MSSAIAEAPSRPDSPADIAPAPAPTAKGECSPYVGRDSGLGPLLAVCGLAGGAGTTTLSYLVALAAARQATGPVLVADTGGPSGALASCAGVEVPRSLGQLAVELASGVPLGAGVYAEGRHGLRVLASGPEFASQFPGEDVSELLADSRNAHRLTVLDCGTLAGELQRKAAAAATHTAWVLAATVHGVERARCVLDAAPPVPGRELIVARHDPRGAPLRRLRRIAAERGAPLILMPHLAALEGGRVHAAAEQAQVPVQAILGLLTR